MKTNNGAKATPAAKEVTHTPTPWVQIGVGRFIAKTHQELSIASATKIKGRNEKEDIENEELASANAAFIVRAVNAHDELRCELKRLHKKEHPKFGDKTCWTCLAIAKAEGK